MNKRILKTFWSAIYDRIKSSAIAFSSLFFVHDAFFGLFVFILSFYNINIGIAGLWGLISLHIFDHFADADHKINNGYYLIYNPLLVSMGVGYVFSINLIILIMISFLSVVTYLITVLIRDILYKYYLPVLSIPFCIIMVLFFLAKKSYSNLHYIISPKLAFAFDASWIPTDLSLFFRSIGAIIFSPFELVGIGIFLLILKKSRNMAFIMVSCFYFGIEIEKFLTPLQWNKVSLIYSYNYILIAIGLGAVFMLPTLKSIIILPFAISLSILLNDALLAFFEASNIPVFTASFNITVIVFLYALKALKFKNFPTSYGRIPEETLDKSSLDNLKRNYISKIQPPFFGTFDTYQSFDDVWTHTGEWKYALDFVYRDSNKKTYKSNKLLKEDYYSFGAPVRSPINGVVTGLSFDHRDNEIGCVDTKNNWGNHLIIYSSLGFYVVVCHLKQHSSQLKMGDAVTSGQIIALCGNSGYSPEPHLHLQLQGTNYLGDTTIPFCFDHYIEKNKLVFNATPERGTTIKFIGVKNFSYIMSYDLEKKITYDIINIHTQKKERITISTNLDKKTGRFFWSDGLENRIYIIRKEASVSLDYFEGDINSPLAFLYSSIPEAPFYRETDIEWESPLAARVSMGKLEFIFRMFFSFFFFGLKHSSASLKFVNDQGDISFSSKYLGNKTYGKISFNHSGDISRIESNVFNFNWVA